MNYYNPNYYMNNYPYNSQYPFPNQQQQQSPQMSFPQPQQILNGKIVDSEDVVKATEVPIGGYGIFPKADLSEIYIKSWNNNGTTSVITFKPTVVENQKEKEELNNLLLQKMDILENKLDVFLSQSVDKPKKAEVPKNGF